MIIGPSSSVGRAPVGQNMTWMDKTKQAQYISDRRRKYKLRLIEHKGGKCERCGYSKCPSALDFHHIGEKEDKISRIYNRGWKRILEEVESTILVCANCHREIHSNH